MSSRPVQQPRQPPPVHTIGARMRAAPRHDAPVHQSIPSHHSLREFRSEEDVGGTRNAMRVAGYHGTLGEAVHEKFTQGRFSNLRKGHWFKTNRQVSQKLFEELLHGLDNIETPKGSELTVNDALKDLFDKSKKLHFEQEKFRTALATKLMNMFKENPNLYQQLIDLAKQWDEHGQKRFEPLLVSANQQKIQSAPDQVVTFQTNMKRILAPVLEKKILASDVQDTLATLLGLGELAGLNPWIHLSESLDKLDSCTIYANEYGDTLTKMDRNKGILNILLSHLPLTKNKTDVLVVYKKTDGTIAVLYKNIRKNILSEIGQLSDDDLLFLLKNKWTNTNAPETISKVAVEIWSLRNNITPEPRPPAILKLGNLCHQVLEKSSEVKAFAWMELLDPVASCMKEYTGDLQQDLNEDIYSKGGEPVPKISDDEIEMVLTKFEEDHKGLGKQLYYHYIPLHSALDFLKDVPSFLLAVYAQNEDEELRTPLKDALLSTLWKIRCKGDFDGDGQLRFFSEKELDTLLLKCGLAPKDYKTAYQAGETGNWKVVVGSGRSVSVMKRLLEEKKT